MRGYLSPPGVHPGEPVVPRRDPDGRQRFEAKDPWRSTLALPGWRPPRHVGTGSVLTSTSDIRLIPSAIFRLFGRSASRKFMAFIGGRSMLRRRCDGWLDIIAPFRSTMFPAARQDPPSTISWRRGLPHLGSPPPARRLSGSFEGCPGVASSQDTHHICGRRRRSAGRCFPLGTRLHGSECFDDVSRVTSVPA